MSLKRRRVLITAGPTREYLDPVRYLTNASSGAMGFALAEAARRRGAEVVVISGPTCVRAPKGIRLVPVVSARQMFKKTVAASRRADVVIGAAAVGDWRVSRVAAGKIKKTGGKLTLSLVPNPDIIREVFRRRRGHRPVIVGFALETDRLLSNAKKKLKKKGLDLIVANRETSIGGSRTRIAILERGGRTRRFPPGTKRRAAGLILDQIERRLKSHENRTA